jgi:hypothetical protein
LLLPAALRADDDPATGLFEDSRSRWTYSRFRPQQRTELSPDQAFWAPFCHQRTAGPTPTSRSIIPTFQQCKGVNPVGCIVSINPPGHDSANNGGPARATALSAGDQILAINNIRWGSC